MQGIYAHSVLGRPYSEWEPLRDHASRVAERAASFAETFGFAEAARAAGLLHDIGKCSAAFQSYIRRPEHGRGPDHSTAGAREACKSYPGPLGRMLAFVISGHHAGLADGTDLEDRLGKTLDPYDGWQKEVGTLPGESLVHGGGPRARSPHRGFSEAFLIRMLFSCLVDADFIETEAFYASRENRPVDREGFTALESLNERLQTHMTRKRTEAEPGPLTTIRAEILDHAVGKAELPPGLFTLTVPTGGGKTLTSLSFALEHAVRYGLRRVVYVIPFTSIIEQTAEVFRAALGTERERNEADILEHHASFDWEAAVSRGRQDRGRDGGNGAAPLDRLRRSAENWAAPVIVTTAVQFFESLYADRTSRCRKLHNLARSVIVLDEAQTLPLHLLKPCMAVLDELQRNYGASIVLCTATQPALCEKDGFEAGFKIDDDRELAPEPERLYRVLKRAEVERRSQPVADAEIEARFAEQPQMLCIVNTRTHAQALFRRIKDLPGAVHLTTLMCPAHRRAVLAEARSRLTRGEPVRIVSTSLIEAGVDIDFPEVWRAAAGIDSIAQAAGRCNREGRLPGFGRVVVFEPVDEKPPPDLEQAWQAGRAVLRSTLEPLGIEAVEAYFKVLYRQKGAEALDAARVDGALYQILNQISDRAPQKRESDPKLAFPFKTIAKAFRLIDDGNEPVVVPWRAAPQDDAAAAILGRIASMDRPLGPDLRRLQQYVVSIPKNHRDLWLASGVLRPVHPALGEGLLRFEDLSHYDSDMGLLLDEPQQRSAASNIMQ